MPFLHRKISFNTIILNVKIFRILRIFPFSTMVLSARKKTQKSSKKSFWSFNADIICLLSDKSIKSFSLKKQIVLVDLHALKLMNMLPNPWSYSQTSFFNFIYLRCILFINDISWNLYALRKFWSFKYEANKL